MKKSGLKAIVYACYAESSSENTGTYYSERYNNDRPVNSIKLNHILNNRHVICNLTPTDKMVLQENIV